MTGAAMPATLIFDLDGTLIDSADQLGLALNQLLAEWGREPVSGDVVRRSIGDGVRPLVERGFAATGPILTEDEVGPAVARFLALYGGLPADPACLYPGVPETLRRLAGAGHAMGLCTNKPWRIACGILAGLGLDPFFAMVVGGDSLPQRKPAPEPLLAVIAGLRGITAQAVMIGDGPNDVAAVRAAGIPAIVVTYGYPLTSPANLSADLMIDRFADLPDALETVSGRRRS